MKQEKKELEIEKLYQKIEPTELNFNIFKTVSNEWNIVTAGSQNDYNSMIAGWGAYGIQFDKPVGLLFLAANRYTLEQIRECGTYTISYLDTTYQEQKMILGSNSGRNSDKMKEINLSPIITLNSNIAYKEAHTIIEFKVEGISESSPNDFSTQEHKDFMEEIRTKGDGVNYHQVITAIITDVWIKK